MFNFNNYPTESKYYDNSNQLLEKSKINRGAAIEEFVRLMTKCIHSQKIKANTKAKEMNINRNEY